MNVGEAFSLPARCLAHCAEKWTRFSALNDAPAKSWSIGSIPKVDSTFGSDALVGKLLLAVWGSISRPRAFIRSMTRPIIILVEPQLAENIGMVARAMANFGLSELRLVSPRNGWPKKGAHSAASGATHILEGAKLYPGTREAIADLNYVFATTAREREQMKRVFAPEPAMREAQARLADGQGVGILFG